MTTQFSQDNLQNIYNSIQNVDLSKQDAREKMMNIIEQYDQLFQKQFDNPTPQQLAQSYKHSESKVELPNKGCQLEQNLKSQFIADGPSIGQYQHMMRHAQVPSYEVPKVEVKKDDIVHNNFIPVQFNYQDMNANSRAQPVQQTLSPSLFAFSQSLAQPYRQTLNPSYVQTIQLTQQLQQIHSEIENSGINIINNQPTQQQQQVLDVYQGQQRQLMNHETVEPITQEGFLNKIKLRMNQLGGVEDTIQVMKQSLMDYEEQMIVRGPIEGQVQLNSSIKPQRFMYTQPPVQQQFHPFGNYMTSDTRQPLEVFKLSQTLREQKIQQQQQQQTI